MPIVEPEVLMDGDHTIERCYEVTSETLVSVFAALRRHRIRFDGMLLKSNMVLSGTACPEQAGVHEVAEATIRCLRENVPAAVPGIVFLSGGQSDELATAHLDAMNRFGPQPWQLSFSYGRALQAPALKAWKGETANVSAAKMALYHRAQLNGAARFGRYSEEMEKSELVRECASMTRIGVLTGGGDVPGLNPCIKTLVYGAVERGYEVVGLLRGWAGLLDYDLDATEPQTQCFQPLTKADVRTIDRTGGTILHTSRTNPGKVKPERRAGFPQGTGPRRVGRSVRLHRPLPGGDRSAGPGLAGPHRRRRHPLLRPAARPRRRTRGGGAEDDGQRRVRHRLLHRVLDRGHPQRAVHPPAADLGRGRTSASLSSSCSAATAGRHRCLPPTWRG